MTEQPRTVRLKTYTAETGLVYQYYFVGKRRALQEPAAEFVFDVSSDRHVRFSVGVFVHDAALGEWHAMHRRPLVDAEIYAAAKMRLLRAFDEIEDLFATGRRVEVNSATLEEFVSALGVE
jgi:predicted nucleic acid-binding protein